MGFRSGEFAGQSSTSISWSFNQLLVLLALWAGAKSCWNENEISIFKKLVSRRKHEELQNVLVNWSSYQHQSPLHLKLSDCGNLTLYFKQLGLMSFSTRAARYFACDSHAHLVSKDGEIA